MQLASRTLMALPVCAKLQMPGATFKMMSNPVSSCGLGTTQPSTHSGPYSHSLSQPRELEHWAMGWWWRHPSLHLLLLVKKHKVFSLEIAYAQEFTLCSQRIIWLPSLNSERSGHLWRIEIGDWGSLPDPGLPGTRVPSLLWEGMEEVQPRVDRPL